MPLQPRACQQSCGLLRTSSAGNLALATLAATTEPVQAKSDSGHTGANLLHCSLLSCASMCKRLRQLVCMRSCQNSCSGSSKNHQRTTLQVRNESMHVHVAACTLINLCHTVAADGSAEADAEKAVRAAAKIAEAAVSRAVQAAAQAGIEYMPPVGMQLDTPRVPKVQCHACICLHSKPHALHQQCCTLHKPLAHCADCNQSNGSLCSKLRCT